MVNELYDDNSELIIFSDLLNAFDLDLNLPNNLMNIKLPACLMSSKLFIKNNEYRFEFKDYFLRITPEDSFETITISYTPNSDLPQRDYYYGYGRDGSLIDASYHLMTISDLLILFNLDLNLSKQLLNIGVDSCLQNAKLTVDEESYIFKYEYYSLIINPQDNSRPVTVRHDFDDPRLCGFCSYDWNGSICSIS